jgi:phosphoglycerate dehydrogenase-like enzyme
MAEYTVMAAMYLTKSIKFAHDQLVQGNWVMHQMSSPPEIPLEFGSLVFGVLGCGGIGQEVARHANTLGCKVIYHNRTQLLKTLEEEIGIEYVSFEDLLKNSDVLSVNVPLTEDTVNLLGGGELKSMKKGAVLVNTSRGGVVDEVALAEVLESEHLRGAAVDVFKDEPDLSGCPLLGLDNVMLTPHISAISPVLMKRAAVYTMENLNRVFEGKAPLRIVN